MTNIQEKLVFDRSNSIVDKVTHYCPGCQHGVAHRLAGELLDEMGLTQNTLLVTSIGCSVFLYNYLKVDSIEAPHGRAPAVATGVKRSRPDKFVLSYQGDGDLASIGMAEIIHCANRGEKVSIIFINNTVYGMTGGQMAPTTLEGQITTTSPAGRNPKKEGMPIRMSEIISNLGGTAFCARAALNNIKNIRQAKKAMKKAFEVQLEGLGFGFVELLSTCPTNWRMTPIQANERIEKEMIPYFPLGVFKDITKEAEG